MPCFALRPAVGVVLSIVLSAPALSAPHPPAAKPPAPAPHEARDSKAALGKPGLLILEDAPQPLVPKQPPDDRQHDRLEALAMFSAGRMLEQREKYPEALRLYERAFRFDPKAVTILRAIVPLAYQLERHAEAVRYALKLVELENADPLLLNQLGTYLTEVGDWQGAARLYERALAARPADKDSGPHVVLRMQMGRLYHLLDEYDKAAESFALVCKALDHPERFGIDERMKKVILGDAAPTYSLMGEAFFEAKRYDDAAAAFNKANKIDPNAALLSYRLGQVDLAKGKPESALEKLQPYLDGHLSDEGLEPYEVLADALKALKREKELLPKLESLHASDEKNVPLGYFLAEELREKGLLDKAEPLYRSLLERAPTALGYRSLAEIYRKNKQPEPLLDMLGQMVEKNPTLDLLDDEAEKIGGDAAMMTALVETAEKAYEADPKQFGPGRSLAMALVARQAKKYDASAKFFDRAVRLAPDRSAQLLLNWGLGSLLNERYAEAAVVFRRGAEEKGKNEQKAIFYFYLASALAMDDQTEAALAAARKAVELQPGVARYHGRVGWVYYHAQQLGEADKAYRELVGRFGSQYGSTETRRAIREARLVLSNIAVLRKQSATAEEQLELVLDEFPDDVAAMNDLGYLWVDENKNVQRAYRMIQAAVAAEPDNTAYRDSLGWALFRLGRAEEAVKELEKAAQDDSDPTIHDHLGDAYLACGQVDKARRAWEKAAEGFKKREEKDTLERVEEKIRDSRK